MLFSRTKGREVEPPQDTFVKGFGNLYIAIIYNRKEETYVCTRLTMGRAEHKLLYNVYTVCTVQTRTGYTDELNRGNNVGWLHI